MSQRRALVSSLTLILVLAFTLPGAQVALAAGEFPQDPLDLDIGDSLAVVLSPGEETWIRASSPPAPTDTHVVFSFSPLDVRLRLYATLEDAIAGNQLAEDTSGSLTYPLGFPQFFLHLEAESTSTETVELATSTGSQPVDACPWSGPCVAVTVAGGRPSGPALLRTARGFRDEVLARTSRGRTLVQLYYDLSFELVPQVLYKPSLGADLYGLVQELLPTVQSALSIARGEEEDARIPARALAAGAELCALVQSLSLRAPVAEEIGRVCAEALGQQADSLRGAMEALGVLPPAIRPSSDFTIVVKFARDIETPTITSRALSLGDPVLDSLFRPYAVVAVEPVFLGIAEHGMNRIFTITFTPATVLGDVLDSLSRSQHVTWAEPDRLLWAVGDVYYPDQWGLHRIDVEPIRKTTTGAPEVIVAVGDTGLDVRHGDFQGVRIVDGYDFVDDDDDPHDGHGHGTHVTGVIAAMVDNGYGIAGIAPQVTIIPVKVLSDEGSGTASGVAQGIRYAADAGARVISLSLGGDRTEVIEEALRYARGKGALLVAAAGNDGEDELSHPASSEHAMAITATDEEDDLASFSNYGEGVDLAAPGVDVVSTFKDGWTCTGSGTSMATPHVSGVAALVLSLLPELSVDELREHLHRTAVDLGAPGWDPFFGYGLVSAKGAVGSLTGAIFADGFESGTTGAWH